MFLCMKCLHFMCSAYILEGIADLKVISAVQQEVQGKLVLVTMQKATLWVTEIRLLGVLLSKVLTSFT